MPSLEPAALTPRHDWTLAEAEQLFALPFTTCSPGAAHASGLPRPGHRADEHAAVDQDRRLPRGLRLLSAERALRHRRGSRRPDAARCRCWSARARRAPPAPRVFAWARPTARPKRRNSSKIATMVREVQRAGARDLRDARHAQRRAGAATQGCGPRLLQPQSRYLRGVLRARSSPPAPTRIGSIR